MIPIASRIDLTAHNSIHNIKLKTERLRNWDIVFIKLKNGSR